MERYRNDTGTIQELYSECYSERYKSQYDTIRFVRLVLSGRYHQFEVKLHIVTDIKVK